MFISKTQVISIIERTIENRTILLVRYQHTTDGEIVEHKIAPFDIGSSNPNPKIRERNSENLYAHSFTHRDKKNGLLDPMICSFNINNFLVVTLTDEKFDETELAIINYQKSIAQKRVFDYRTYTFAFLPNRNWFK